MSEAYHSGVLCTIILCAVVGLAVASSFLGGILREGDPQRSKGSLQGGEGWPELSRRHGHSCPLFQVPPRLSRPHLEVATMLSVSCLLSRDHRQGPDESLMGHAGDGVLTGAHRVTTGCSVWLGPKQQRCPRPRSPVRPIGFLQPQGSAQHGGGTTGGMCPPCPAQPWVPRAQATGLDQSREGPPIPAHVTDPKCKHQALCWPPQSRGTNPVGSLLPPLAEPCLGLLLTVPHLGDQPAGSPPFQVENQQSQGQGMREVPRSVAGRLQSLAHGAEEWLFAPASFLPDFVCFYLTSASFAKRGNRARTHVQGRP